jgi:hypothetical protein
MEIWKSIVDYPNYSVSNFGNVRNDIKNNLIKGGIRNGYKFVMLSKNNQQKSFKIHRLVGQYFLDNFDPNLDIDHIDRNKVNNNSNNLRSVSRSINLRNKNKKSNCSSKYKGVYQLNNGKWRASGYNNGKVFNLGHFVKEDDAYNKVIEYSKLMNIPYLE